MRIQTLALIAITFTVACDIDPNGLDTFTPTDTDDVPPQTRCALTPGALGIGPQPAHYTSVSWEILKKGSMCATAAGLIGGFDVIFDETSSPQISIPHAAWVPNINISYDTVCRVASDEDQSSQSNTTLAHWVYSAFDAQWSELEWTAPITGKFSHIALVEASVPGLLPKMTVWIKAIEHDQNGHVTLWEGYGWCQPVGDLGTNPFLYPDQLLLDEDPFMHVQFAPDE